MYVLYIIFVMLILLSITMFIVYSTMLKRKYFKFYLHWNICYTCFFIKVININVDNFSASYPIL